jgi:hypothetical protein
MPESSALTRHVDLRGCTAFARNLIGALGATGGGDLLPKIRAGVHAECPQCHMRLVGEEVLVLAGAQEPDPAVSPKLHRLWQGYCGRNGCDANFYEFEFDPVAGVDWSALLGQMESAAPEAFTEPAAVAAEQAAVQADRKKRSMRRALLGVGVVLMLLFVRQWMSGGAIPFIREPRRFTADPETIPKLGETNAPPPAGTNQPRTFRAAPEPGSR